MGKGRSPNDDRADRFNPNNDAYWAAEANEATQRGDDDWDDDDAPVEVSRQRNPASTRALVVDTNLRPGSVIQTPSDEETRTALADPRGRAGPLVIDRLSHLVNLLRVLVQRGHEHRVETPESREERARRLAIDRKVESLQVLHTEGKLSTEAGRGVVEEILKLAKWPAQDAADGARRAQERWNSWTRSVPLGNGLGGLGHADVIVDRIVAQSVDWRDLWGVEIGEFKDDFYGKQRVWLSSVPDGVHSGKLEDSKFEALTWRETLQRSIADLHEALLSCSGDAILCVTPRRSQVDAPWHDPQADEDERRKAWEFTCVPQSAVASALGALSELAVHWRDGGWGRRRVLNPDQVAVLVPGTIGAAGTDEAPADSMAPALRAIARWLAPLDPRLDPTAILQASVAALVRAEWAGARSVVLGLACDPIGGVRLSCHCANSDPDAAEMQRSMVARGQRVVVLRCPKLATPTTWDWVEPEDGCIASYSESSNTFRLCVPRIRGKETLESLSR